jgi:hypothetical protein
VQRADANDGPRRDQLRGEDAYSGAIDATAEGMTMKINLSGKKLGTCDKPIG